MSEEAVRAALPELDAIEDEDLRAGVIEAWTTAIAENEIDDLRSVPWLPPTQRDLSIPDEYLIDHVRDVAAGAISFVAALLDRRGAVLDIDTDVLIAGALVHDVSKLAEFSGMESTEVHDLLGHPYYGVHLVAQVDLPIELAHIVLSHTSRTNVEPATIEAEMIRRIDEVAAAAIRWRSTDDLRTV
ncbi:MAG: HD domain-containing protein [Halobellus sp.]|uniref:HD domain-containing protein n=1 Tax=Halobellus sp. TaxID=1979212 RepID=UPI0035D459E1